MLRKLFLALAGLSLSWSAYADPLVGSDAPDFALPAADGKTYNLKDFKDQYVVLEWWNSGCPYVQYHYKSGNIQAQQKELKALNGGKVQWLTILSSARGKQGYMESAEIKKYIEENKANPTAVLLDPDGRVGKLYGAKTTPHMFVIDPKGKVIYKGAIDDNPQPFAAKSEPRKYVQLALNSAVAGKPVETSSTKPYGCSVKYP